MRREGTAVAGSAWQQVLLACVLALAVLPQAYADALDGTLEVRSAYVTVDNGVYQLTARIAYPVNDEIRTALKDGVSLSFDLEAQVQKLRRYWTNATTVDITLRRELTWHAVTERYVVRDVERGELGSYATLDQALTAIGTVEGWPVVVEPQLEPAAGYEIGVRASIRRGTLSGALRALIWWSSSWQRSSEWYTWSLPR
jgi:Domain of unknown function (DUF4390)